MTKKPTKKPQNTAKKDLKVPMNMSFEDALKVAATTVIKKKTK